MKTNFNKIRKFLGGLSQLDRHILSNLANTAANARLVQKEMNYSKKDFCAKFKIKPARYNDFLSGNFDYNLLQLATITSELMSIDIERSRKMHDVKFNSSDSEPTNM